MLTCILSAIPKLTIRWYGSRCLSGSNRKQHVPILHHLLGINSLELMVCLSLQAIFMLMASWSKGSL